MMENDAMTFDEILSDSFYKSEFDRRVTKAIATATAKYTDYEDIKKRLGEADATIADFKKLDFEGVKKAADDWKLKAEKAEKDAADKIADMEFNNRLTGAIASAKGKNSKAISALLDTETLKASKNQEADIKAALEALKKDNGYLFETTEVPPPYATGTGTQNIQTKNTPEVNAIRVAAGLKAE